MKYIRVRVHDEKDAGFCHIDIILYYQGDRGICLAKRSLYAAFFDGIRAQFLPLLVQIIISNGIPAAFSAF